MMENSSTQNVNPRPNTDSTSPIYKQISSIISKQRITYGSYLRIKTSIPFFKPTYLLSPTATFQHQPNSKSKHRKKKVNIEHKSLKTPINQNDFILNYGSQLFLQEYNNLLEFSKGIQVSYETIVPYFDDFLFGEILMEGKYLTKIDNAIVLRQDPSSQGIWSIQQQQKDKVKIVNIIDRSYLALDKQTNKLTSAQNSNIFTLFHIKPTLTTNNFILTPFNPKHIKSGENIKDLDELSYEESFKIQIMPINNSALSIHYELKFAQWILLNNPSLPFISSLVSELIYYDIPQFNQNQKILSQHIQALFKEYGIIQLIVQYVKKLINSQMSIKTHKNLKTVCKMLRLLCLNSKVNTNMIAEIVHKLLQYNYYFSPILTLIKNNAYFGIEFQKKGWYNTIVSKLALLQSTQQYQVIWQVYQLLSQFCTLSIPNQYLLMHTFQSTQHQKQEMISMSKYSVDPSSVWLKIFSEGLYIFVQNERSGKFQQIQLNTFLHQKSFLQRDLFINQIKLISSFCSGFNVNALDRYNLFLKSLAPYCYKQNFPTITDPKIKNTILTTLTNSYSPPHTQAKYSLQYSLGIINIEKHAKKNNDSVKDPSQKTMHSIYQELKHLYNWVQRNVYRYLENDGGIEEICKENDVDGNTILAQIKIIQLCLSARLITVTKRKQAQFMQYIKKIFENVNQPKSNSKKVASSENGRNSDYSFSNDDVDTKKEEFPLHGILSFLYLVIRYSPLYEGYLRVLKINRKQNNKFNDVFIKLIKKPTFQFKEEQVGENIDKNDYMAYIFQQIYLQQDSTVNEEQQLKFLQYYDNIKLYAFRTLALMYQNIHEQKLQYLIQSLSYLIKHPNQINNKFNIDSSFKYPMIDIFRPVLLQQWYLASDLEIFNEVTNCLRYVYDQNQIYSRAVNHILVVAQHDLFKLTNSLSGTMKTLQKLAQTIHNWFLPPIIDIYQQNYRSLMRSLQYVNSQLRKYPINDKIQLLDFQRVLNNLNIIPICLNITSHTSLYENGSKHPQCIQKIRTIHEELYRILQFFTFESIHNSKKIIISIGQYITKSSSLFPLFVKILNYRNKGVHDYYKRLSQLNLMLTDQVLQNIIQSLPSSKYYLQNLLHLDDLTFIKMIEKMMNNPKNKEILKSKEYLEEFALGYEFREFIHKISYRLLEISHCGRQFLSWYFDFFLKNILSKECKANLHFKSKIIKSLTFQYIWQHCYIACNLYKILMKQKQSKVKYGDWISSEEGNVMIIQYILGQLLSSIMMPQQKIFIQYIAYYFYDLLPLSIFARQILKIGDLSEKILQKIEEYSKIIEKNMETKSQNMRSMRDSISEKQKQEMQTSKKHESTHYGKIDVSVEDLEGILQKDSFIKNIKRFIQAGVMIDENFQPRPIRLQMVVLSDHEPLKTYRNKRNDDSNSENINNQNKTLEKKAIKKWFKARLIFNEKIHSQVNKGYERWINDIGNVELQFSQENREKVINSDDIIHKLYHSIMNISRIKLSQQNEIFLMKCALVHLKQVQSKKKKKNKSKSKKNTAQKRKKQEHFEEQSLIIVKGLKVKDIGRSLIDQVSEKIREQPNNPLSISLMLKMIQVCLKIQPQELDNIIQNLIVIADACRQTHLYHQEIMKIYENDHNLQSIFVDCFPLTICLEILGLMSDKVNVSEICFIDLTEGLVKIRWQYSDLQKYTENIEQNLKEQSPQLYEQIVQNLLKSSEYYQAISTL